MYFVSDRALALVNLAVKKYEVSSVADCFHFKYIINKLCCLALSAKLNSAKANYEEAQKSKELIDLRTEQYIRIQFHTDIYVKTMRTISHVLHPFYDGYKPNTKNRVEQEINLELSRINQLTIDCEIKDKYKLISKAQNQVSDVVAVIPIWHDLVSDEIEQMNLDDNQKYWFMSYLLPKMYWIQALNKTKYKPIREQLKKELQVCEQNKFLIYEQSEDEYEILKEKAVELCRKFQRASSQVEGRNGFLSLINHNQKSFDNTRLEVMTVIHNFDTRGIDGKTPAERLFGKQIEFQPLFEYILNNFDDLPRPRKRKGRLKINAVQH